MWSRIITAVVLVSCGGVAGMVVGCGGGGGAGPDTATGCTEDTQCSGATPACDVPSGTCVQCTDDNVTACTGGPPACTPDHTCQVVCEADTDCASGACLADGSCADADAILFVTRDVAAGACTLADKCTFAVALTKVSATKNVIHLDPLDYQFATGFLLLGNFLITGIGASIEVAAGSGNVFTIPSGNEIKVDFLQLGGTMAAPADQAIACTNGTLFARRIGVAFTSGIGINVSGCGFRLERSTVHDARGGGIEVGGGSITTMFDNMIFHNGDAAASTFGGVNMLGSVDPASRIEFNTIVDNTAAVSVGVNIGGIRCSSPFAAPNNLIARNSLGSATTMDSQTLGTCTYPTSIIAAQLTNLALDHPDSAPFSFKLTAASTMLIDQAVTTSTVNVDFENDARPQGAQNDIGADEFKP